MPTMRLQQVYSSDLIHFQLLGDGKLISDAKGVTATLALGSLVQNLLFRDGDPEQVSAFFLSPEFTHIWKMTDEEAVNLKPFAYHNGKYWLFRRNKSQSPGYTSNPHFINPYIKRIEFTVDENIEIERNYLNDLHMDVLGFGIDVDSEDRNPDIYLDDGLHCIITDKTNYLIINKHFGLNLFDWTICFTGKTMKGQGFTELREAGKQVRG